MNALLRVGNTIYIGGDFTQLLGPNGEIVKRQYLAAVDATTGQPLPWNPGADGIVHSLAASPDGTTIYAAGQFRHVGGLVRTRIAAIDATTGAVRAWTPTVGAIGRAIVTIGNRVYVGGIFTTRGAAKVDRRPPATAWQRSTPRPAPSRHGTRTSTSSRETCWSRRTAASSSSGGFTTVGGSPSNYIASLDATTGALLPWNDHPVDQVQGIAQGPGQIFIGNGTGAPPGNQVVAYDINTGTQQWLAQGDGDVQDVTYLDGVVYAGGHFDTMSGQPVGQARRLQRGHRSAPRLGRHRRWVHRRRHDDRGRRQALRRRRLHGGDRRRPTATTPSSAARPRRTRLRSSTRS